MKNTKNWRIFAYGFMAAMVLFGTIYFFSQGARPELSRTVAKDVSALKPARAAVQIEASQAGAIDLKLTTVKRENLVEDLRVVATVVPDESRISHIHTRVAGWVEKLYIANTGEMVRAGQPIAAIYSQELHASQIEYLSAREMTGPASAVLESGRKRLTFFGMSEAEITAIEKSNTAHRLVTLYAPRSGILAHRGIAVGTTVDPSTEIAVILDLSRVWVWAEVPAAASADIHKGMRAKLEFGQRGFPATAEFIDPVLSDATRALRVRFSLPNPDGNLRPGSYGTALFTSTPRTALTVPREALVDTGASQYVYVLKTDGVYEPRTVRIGLRQKDKVEIQEGLSEGERIVVSGVFLLDSESRLRASGDQIGGHSAHGKPASTPTVIPKHTDRERHD